MASDTKARIVVHPEQGETRTAEGFDARLKGVTLADLIQMKCLSGATECVRIKSADKIGMLQFASGNLTHAVAGDLAGGPAVIELLNWKTGACEPVGTALPGDASVRGPWQSLLLAAATALDERARFQQQNASSASRSASREGRVALQEKETSTAIFNVQSPPAARSAACAVKLDSAGRVLKAKGEVDDLAAATAYVLHVAEHIGTSLGLDAFKGCEFRAGELRTVVVVEANGEVLAVQSNQEADVAEAKMRIGF
jgi:hypothetical protein